MHTAAALNDDARLYHEMAVSGSARLGQVSRYAWLGTKPGIFFSSTSKLRRLKNADYEFLARLIQRTGNLDEPFLVSRMGILHGSGFFDTIPRNTGPSLGPLGGSAETLGSVRQHEVLGVMDQVHAGRAGQQPLGDPSYTASQREGLNHCQQKAVVMAKQAPVMLLAPIAQMVPAATVQMVPPTTAPTAVMAPWAKEIRDGSKGLFLKEIQADLQAMEATKAAQKEEVTAAAARRAMADLQEHQ